ncbi:MAG: hypothetical protein RL368_1922 [Pseudomonadota bacterium]
MLDYSYYKKLLIKAGALLLISAPVVQAADLQGLWKFKGGDNRITADWAIGVSNGVIYGSSYWSLDGKPLSDPTDRLDGTVNGNTVSITRYFTQYVGSSQIIKGTIGTDGTISGTWTGAGCSGSCTWTATVIPLSTAATTTTQPTVCPTTTTQPTVCPTTTTQPVVTTANCTASYTPSIGRLVIPCLTVPVAQPFGPTQYSNYSIEMQQRTGSFAFDLDLSTVKQK